MKINKNADFEFTCPKCGFQKNLKLKDLEPEYVCKNCQTIYKGKQLIEDIEKSMNRAENELRDTIKRLNMKNK